jgi:hypothetical protein
MLLKNGKITPDCACGLILELFGYTFSMEPPLIEGSVEKQYEIRSPAWSGETTEGLASPSDCHKTAKIMSDEDALLTTYHPCFNQIWNLVLKFSSESIVNFNFNVDQIMYTFKVKVEDRSLTKL